MSKFCDDCRWHYAPAGLFSPPEMKRCNRPTMPDTATYTGTFIGPPAHKERGLLRWLAGGCGPSARFHSTPPEPRP